MSAARTATVLSHARPAQTAEALRTLSVWNTAMSLLGSLTLLAIGIGAFYAGLRRYESGNLISMNG